MPLSADNQVQQAVGVVDSATSVTVGFDTGLGYSACTAGNAVVVLVLSAGQPDIPAGFDQDLQLFTTGGPGAWWFRLPVTSGGETTWTVTESTSASVLWMWRAVEVTGLAVPPSTPFAQSARDGMNDGTTFTGAADFTRNGGEVGGPIRLDVMKLGVSAYVGPASAATVAEASAWVVAAGNLEGAWSKVTDRVTANGSGSNSVASFWDAYSGSTIAGLGDIISVKLPTTLLPGANTTSDFYFGGWASYASFDSPAQDPIVMGTGFEFGTHSGITGGPTGAPGPAQIADAVSGTFGTAYQVVTTAPKNGTYHLRITAAATTAFVRWTTNTLGTGLGQAVFGGYVKCVSATTNPAVLAEFAPAAGTIAQIVYNPSTTKIGVRWGSGGTPSYQAGTTALGAYAWVDLLAVFNATTWTLTWRCEEGGAVPTTQTSPANLTGQVASTWASATLGSATSQTMTADYDDVCLSNTLTDYPLGRHKVVLLVPDTAVPAVFNGSAGANMSAVTNNAVGSSLTTTGAANVPALLDEVPPNFSATADGVAAVTAGTTDSVDIAMTTYTAAATERIDAVRMYMTGWAVSSTAASFGLRGFNGTTETVLVSGSTTHTTFGSTTTGSATVPGWYAKNYPDSNGWTQAKLNALVARIGYSSDATPDIGASAVYAEVAVMVDFVSGLPPKDPTVLTRSPRPVEQSAISGNYAPVNPSTIIGG